ncbi:hypothetical protein ACF0H5_003951 [Mactra antiquata]
MFRLCFIVIFASISVNAKPNIVLFMADDLGYGDLGCYGNTSVKTPNIDKLATEGVKMTQHLAAASLCTPSRSAMMTGRYPIRSGMASSNLMRVNIWPYSACGLPPSEITYAELAKDAGYTTALFGKWHLGVHSETEHNVHHPLNQGFDYFYGTLGTNMDDFGPETKVVTLSRPYWYWELFSIWSVTTVALICLCRARYISVFTCVLLIFLWSMPVTLVYWVFDNVLLFSSFVHRNYDLVEQPIRLAGLSQRLVQEGSEFIRNAVQADKPFLILMSWVHMHTFIETGKAFTGKSNLGRYGDALEELDWSVGEILKLVKSLGLEDDTLVYFTSDNGGHVEIAPDGGYNGILRGGKAHGAPDGGIRVPGMIKWPGVLPKGTETDEPTSLMDLYNLISSAVGQQIPDDRTVDGRDILPLLQGNTEISPHEFMFHYCGNKLQGARYRPRTGTNTWKLVTYSPNLIPGRDICQFVCSCNHAFVLDTPLLYDITSDPGETNPIDSNSKQYKDIVPVILEAMKQHKNSIEPTTSQFSFRKVAPRFDWQPCCNGTFPFNCYCTDPKFPE